MDATPEGNAPQESTQRQEQLFARLQPASELEERVAQQIVSCSIKLEQIEQRLTIAWSQLQKIYEDINQQPSI
jgi:glucan phosphorylase